MQDRPGRGKRVPSKKHGQFKGPAACRGARGWVVHWGRARGQAHVERLGQGPEWTRAALPSSVHWLSPLRAGSGGVGKTKPRLRSQAGRQRSRKGPRGWRETRHAGPRVGRSPSIGRGVREGLPE